MKVVADTNILLRAILEDHPDQVKKAQQALANAESVVITPTVLCGFVWVLTRGYRRGGSEVAALVRGIIGTADVATDRATVEAGLTMLEAGGDFADGVIAFEGAALGADTFLTFDQKAAKLISARGGTVRLLR